MTSTSRLKLRHLLYRFHRNTLLLDALVLGYKWMLWPSIPQTILRHFSTDTTQTDIHFESSKPKFSPNLSPNLISSAVILLNPKWRRRLVLSGADSHPNPVRFYSFPGAMRPKGSEGKGNWRHTKISSFKTIMCIYWASEILPSTVSLKPWVLCARTISPWAGLLIRLLSFTSG